MRKYLAGALFGLSMLAGGISVQAAGVTGESSDIKSLSVGSGTLSAGDSQKVTIGLDSSIQADEALLEVYNETIDYKSVYYATVNEAGQLEFDFEIPEEGTYSITGLKLVDDGNTYEYSLSDLGLTQEFCASGDTDDDTGSRPDPTPPLPFSVPRQMRSGTFLSSPLSGLNTWYSDKASRPTFP